MDVKNRCWTSGALGRAHSLTHLPQPARELGISRSPRRSSHFFARKVLASDALQLLGRSEQHAGARRAFGRAQKRARDLDQSSEYTGIVLSETRRDRAGVKTIGNHAVVG